MSTEECKTTLEQQKENVLHNIVWLRNYYGIPKKRMAELLEIGIGSLNKIESGEMPPRLSAEVIINIYNLFGIHPKDLVGKRFGE
ncbi:MAG: helix-turn-helix transcriptional regulator [Clostridia bacterium]|nr:helix-turn-helix transcriptional regulator [Clostridia bacterium]